MTFGPDVITKRIEYTAIEILYKFLLVRRKGESWSNQVKYSVVRVCLSSFSPIEKLPVPLCLKSWHNQRRLVQRSHVQTSYVVHQTLVQTELRKKIYIQLENIRRRHVRHCYVSQIIHWIKFLEKIKKKIIIFFIFKMYDVYLSIVFVVNFWRTPSL